MKFSEKFFELTLPLDEILSFSLHNLLVQNLLNFICFPLTAATVRHFE